MSWLGFLAAVTALEGPATTSWSAGPTARFGVAAGFVHRRLTVGEGEYDAWGVYHPEGAKSERRVDAGPGIAAFAALGPRISEELELHVRVSWSVAALQPIDAGRGSGHVRETSFGVGPGFVGHPFWPELVLGVAGQVGFMSSSPRMCPTFEAQIGYEWDAADDTTLGLGLFGNWTLDHERDGEWKEVTRRTMGGLMFFSRLEP